MTGQPTLMSLVPDNSITMAWVYSDETTAADFRDATLADLAQLPIQVGGETDQQAWGATLDLATHHQLTLYDAAYLELTLRRNLPLATLDQDLRRAAVSENVRLLGQ